MIKVHREPDNLFLGGAFEDCSFACGAQGRFWHEETNLPFCQPCAKEKTLDDLAVSVGLMEAEKESKKPSSFHDFKFGGLPSHEK